MVLSLSKNFWSTLLISCVRRLIFIVIVIQFYPTQAVVCTFFLSLLILPTPIFLISCKIVIYEPRSSFPRVLESVREHADNLFFLKVLVTCIPNCCKWLKKFILFNKLDGFNTSQSFCRLLIQVFVYSFQQRCYF